MHAKIHTRGIIHDILFHARILYNGLLVFLRYLTLLLARDEPEARYLRCCRFRVMIQNSDAFYDTLFDEFANPALEETAVCFRRIKEALHITMKYISGSVLKPEEDTLYEQLS